MCFVHGLGSGCSGVHDEWNRPDDEPETCSACGEVIDKDDRCGCDDTDVAPVTTVAQVAAELKAKGQAIAARIIAEREAARS